MRFGKVLQFEMLKACNAGKAWTMRDLLAHCAPGLRGVKRIAAQRAVHRLMVAMENTGAVSIERQGIGKTCLYRWNGDPQKPRHCDVESAAKTCDNDNQWGEVASA